MGRSGEGMAISIRRRSWAAPGSGRRAEAGADGGGEEGGAAGGVGAGLQPEGVGEGDAGGAVGGGVEGFEGVDAALDRRAVESSGRGRRGGRRRRGWRWSRSRAGGRRSAPPAWWQPRQTRRSAGSGGRGRRWCSRRTSWNSKRPAAGVVLIASIHVGGGLVAEEEAVGEAGVARAGGPVTGDGDDEAGRGEVAGVGGVALQRTAEGDEGGLDVGRGRRGCAAGRGGASKGRGRPSGKS